MWKLITLAHNFHLKQWISKTILLRLVKEIEAVDEALQRHGLADVRVGSVGLERLKKTAQILQVAQNIPTLISLVPFLELTSNQEYLVTRIKG
jgi:stage III sporulation protein SpoIIIAA